MRLGWPEIVIILVIILVVFGIGKLPQVGAQLGKGIREFRKTTQGNFDDEQAHLPKSGGEVTAKSIKQ